MARDVGLGLWLGMKGWSYGYVCRPEARDEGLELWLWM